MITIAGGIILAIVIVLAILWMAAAFEESSRARVERRRRESLPDAVKYRQEIEAGEDREKRWWREHTGEGL